MTVRVSGADAADAMLALFVRHPDTNLLPDCAGLSPIPVEEDVISLSAILVDADNFETLRNTRAAIDDIGLVDERIPILFKARAFLDLSGRRAQGEDVDARHLRKHRNDVFRFVNAWSTT